MKFSHIAGAAALVVASSSSFAALTPVSPSCSAGDLGATFIDCVGYFSGNLISTSPADIADQTAALALLGATLPAGTWLEKLESISGSTIDFAMNLTGLTIIGVHRGGAGAGAQGTAFYAIDAGAGLDTIAYNLGGLSNAAVYATGGVIPGPIPEPSTYALMLAGLGAVGWVARRRRVQK